MADASATMDESLRAEAFAAQEPAGAVFLSKDGRRRLLLALAGRLAAGMAALWVVALVAGVLGIATPGPLRLPGVRSSPEPSSTTGASTPAPRRVSVTDRAHRVPVQANAERSLALSHGPHAHPVGGPGQRVADRGGRAPDVGSAKHPPAPGTTSPPHQQGTVTTTGGGPGAANTVGHAQTSAGSRADTTPGATVSAEAGQTGIAASKSRADSAPSNPSAAPGSTPASTPAATTPPSDPGRPVIAHP
jgi:hypothetical protein